MRTPKKSNKKRKPDKIWEEIFEDYSVLDKIEEKGYFTITAKEMRNHYKKARPRLMTKFDYWDSLPYIFQKNRLSILPIERGTYIISKFDAYNKLEVDTSTKPKKIHFPSWIKSLNPNQLTSEAKIINCAYVSGILEDLISEELLPTIDGRMSTSTFNFYVENPENSGKIKIENDRSQCEIDGGFEGYNNFVLIEAKTSISKDFLVRQLYYPYRLWNKNLDNRKKIKPVFLVYSSGVFYFLIYRFNDLKNYNSIELVDQKSYIISDGEITLKDIEKIMDEINFVKEPDIPFPQANSFQRVIDLLENLAKEEKLDNEEISLLYDFDYRQAQYYSRACMYLGLAENNQGIIQLTSKGRKILKTDKKDKY